MSSPRGPGTPRRSQRGNRTPSQDVPETPTSGEPMRQPATPSTGTPRRGRPKKNNTPAKSTASDEISTPMRFGNNRGENQAEYPEIPATSPAPSMVPTSPAAGKVIFLIQYFIFIYSYFFI